MLILNSQSGHLKAGSWFLPSIAMLLSLVPCLGGCLAAGKQEYLEKAA